MIFGQKREREREREREPLTHATNIHQSSFPRDVDDILVRVYSLAAMNNVEMEARTHATIFSVRR